MNGDATRVALIALWRLLIYPYLDLAHAIYICAGVYLNDLPVSLVRIVQSANTFYAVKRNFLNEIFLVLA